MREADSLVVAGLENVSQSLEEARQSFIAPSLALGYADGLDRDQIKDVLSHAMAHAAHAKALIDEAIETATKSTEGVSA